MERAHVENLGGGGRQLKVTSFLLKPDRNQCQWNVTAQEGRMKRKKNRQNTKHRSGVHILRAASKMYTCINTQIGDAFGMVHLSYSTLVWDSAQSLH